MNNINFGSENEKCNPKRKPYVIEGIIINELLLANYRNKNNERRLSNLNDLSELNTRTESELLKILNQMVKTKNFFKYCSSWLININPGPAYISDYLNWQAWLKSTANLKETDWKPHLYSNMYYVYQTMIKEGKDQVVNLLGPIGSGKTFNIVHIWEYFCCMVGPENYQIEIFDIIHKSIQLVHMLGSIYRENNIESTSWGMLLKLGFDEHNWICNFDMEAKILDFTLPFSENGRSFSILHAFMTGANSEWKRIFEIPEQEQSLNFFRKFTKTFSESTKKRFRLNDLEIWNKFHYWMKWFKFTKEEIIDILHLLAFLMNLNEIVIQKGKTGKFNNIDSFSVNKGITTKKLSKNLNVDESLFLEVFGNFSSTQEAKTLIISLMKQSYYWVFDFVLNKTKDYWKSYFINLSRKINNKTNINKKIKLIHFIDFPGEVEDMTLGGYSTNVANECLNMYAASSYYEVVEKLLREAISLKHFQPLLSYSVMQTCFGKNGVLDHFSMPFTAENFQKLKTTAKTKKHFKKCFHFREHTGNEYKVSDFDFSCLFSHKNITYNYETLYYEAKALVPSTKISKLWWQSKNYIVKSTYKHSLINSVTSFTEFFVRNLRNLFDPIENIKPFVVYCLHSNNSYKIFFDSKIKKSRTNQSLNNSEDEMPNDVTLDIIKNSLAFPILNWDWYGYKEWMSIDDIVKEFCNDFEKVKDKLVAMNTSSQNKYKDVSFQNMETKDIVNYTLSILTRQGDYIIGKNFVAMKKGTIGRIRYYLNSMIGTVEDYHKELLKTNFKNEKKITTQSKAIAMWRVWTQQKWIKPRRNKFQQAVEK